MNWSDLEWLRSLSSMPIIIKGIQTSEDARLCTEYGVEGLVVSNHGGHALDGTSGTIQMLPEIVEAVGDRAEVYIDGGVRRGSDVLKCLALGAKAVFIGRPIFWGLSVGGEDGMSHVLNILRNELAVAMGLCGLSDIKKADPSLVALPNDGNQRNTTIDELERVTGLLEKGYLIRDEFGNLKSKLLG